MRPWWLSRRFLLTWAVVIVALVLVFIFGRHNDEWLYLEGLGTGLTSA